MTDDTKLNNTWNKHNNKASSIRARLKAVAWSLGKSAATFDNAEFIETGEQPFPKQDEPI